MNFLANMSRRERVLFAVTAAVMAVLVNFYLVKFFITSRADLTKKLEAARSRVDMLKKREAERELWSQRDAWLNGKMPVLGDPEVASKELREFVLEIAKRHTVTIEAPAPGVPVKAAGHISLGVKVTASGSWEAMFNFLEDLQGPEQFIAVEDCDIKVNPEDRTQLRAGINVARWYSPK